MRQTSTRRRFIRKTASGSLGFLFLRNSSSVSSAELNSRLDIALVGVGGRGRWFVNTIPRLGVNVTALCDVNEKRAGDAFKKIPRAKKYCDFRARLDAMDKQIDAVIIATPDHTHAVISSMAMQRGKHVYCEKPLAGTLYEARTIRKRAAECNVATQMGNQGTAGRGFRTAYDLIRSGVIGEVKEVHVWNTGGGPGEWKPPTDAQPFPAYLKGSRKNNFRILPLSHASFGRFSIAKSSPYWQIRLRFHSIGATKSDAIPGQNPEVVFARVISGTSGWGRGRFAPIIPAGCAGTAGVNSAPAVSATGHRIR